MAAPHIPNLKTLSGARGGQRGQRLRGRGRGRGGQDPSSSHVNSGDAPDVIVQRTDDDASASRMSAVEAGYLEDPFASVFHTKPTSRRFPIMNRGTYVRTEVIDKLVDGILDTRPDEPKQIVSLGAGSDTRYFRLLTQRPLKNLVYHEIDFPENTTKKIAAIQQSAEHLKVLRSVQAADDPQPVVKADGSTYLSSHYNIHGVDLRALIPSATGWVGPTLPNLSSNIPTLLISECCLIYLEPEETTAIIEAFTDRLIAAPTALAIVIYEPFRPNDPFGRVMVSNLATRGIQLQTLQTFSSLFRQKERLRKAGFSGGRGAADVDFLWTQWIDNDEKERVSGLEMMDEVEEWRLLAQHYCVVWGWRIDPTMPGIGVFADWNCFPDQGATEDNENGT